MILFSSYGRKIQPAGGVAAHRAPPVRMPMTVIFTERINKFNNQY